MSRRLLVLLFAITVYNFSFSQTFRRNYSLFEQPFIYELAFTSQETTLNGKFILYNTKTVTDTSFTNLSGIAVSKDSVLRMPWKVVIRKKQTLLNYFNSTETLVKNPPDTLVPVIGDSILLLVRNYQTDTAFKKAGVDTIKYTPKEVEDNKVRSFQLYDPLSKEHFSALAKSHLSKIITQFTEGVAKEPEELSKLIDDLYDFSNRKLTESPIATRLAYLEAKNNQPAGTFSVPAVIRGYKVCYPFTVEEDPKTKKKRLKSDGKGTLGVNSPLGHIDYLVLNSSFRIFENQLYANLRLAPVGQPDSVFPVATRLPYNLASNPKDVYDKYIAINYDNYDAVETANAVDSSGACRLIFWLTDVFTYSHDTATGSLSPYVIDTTFAMRGGQTVNLYKRGINNYISLIAFSDILGLNSDVANDYLLTEVEFNFPLKQKIRNRYKYGLRFGNWHSFPGVQGSISASLISGNRPVLRMKRDTVANQFYVNQLDLIRQRTYEGMLSVPLMYHRRNRFVSLDFIPGLRLFGTYLEKFTNISVVDGDSVPQFKRAIAWTLAPQFNFRIRVNPDDWWGFDLNVNVMNVGVQHGIVASYENVNEFEDNPKPDYEKKGKRWFGVYEFNTYFLRNKLSERTDGLFGRIRLYDNFGNRNFHPLFFIGYSSSLGKRVKNY